MRQKTGNALSVGKDCQRHPAGDPQAVFSGDKISIVLGGLCGEDRIAELCRSEGIS